MVRFIEVDPNDVPNYREAHRGRVSYPILKGFLESGLAIGKLDRQSLDTKRDAQSLVVGLTNYIERHEMPIKLFQRQGEVYFVRLDVDEEGNQITDWQERQRGDSNGSVVAPIVSGEAPSIEDEDVDTRFKETKGQVTR